MQLLDPEYYQYTRHAVSVLIVGAGIILLGISISVHEHGSRISVKHLFLTISIGVWLLSEGMGYSSRQDATALIWFKISTVGVVFIPAALFSLTALLVQRERELRAWVKSGVVLSLIFCVFIFSTDLFIKGLYQYSWGRYVRYGWVGAAFIGYFFGVGLFSLINLIKEYRRSTHPLNRRRLRWILISLGFGHIAALDFTATLGVPLYPFGYLPIAAYVLAAAWLSIRHKIVFITPELATNQILETMQGAVIVTDLENKIRVVNRAAQEMIGRRSTDLLGMDLASLDIIPAALHNAVLEGSRPPSREMVWSGGDGRRFTVSLSASLVTDSRSDAPQGVVYVAHDVTERKQAEERLKMYSAELQEANKKLLTLDKMKSDFVSVVSHELRTPLTSIKAFVELILMKPSLQPERKLKLLQIINEESNRLGRLINDLLDLSRIEAGTMPWRSEEVSVHDIIRISLDGILPLVENKGLRLTTEIAGSLPVFHGDRDRMVQVMNNLLSNAVKFTPDGGTVAVEAHMETGADERIVVTVADTGKGIPLEDIPYIFDKFHRSRDVITNNVEGTGLGLTIARQIVEHHGGALTAVSTPGKGSAFTFTIPLDRDKPHLRSNCFDTR